MDRTGPMGQGEMTGRGLGHCQKNNKIFARRFRCNSLFGRALKKSKNQLEVLELEEKLLVEELESLREEKKALTEQK